MRTRTDLDVLEDVSPLDAQLVFVSVCFTLVSPVTGFSLTVVSLCVLPPNQPGLSLSVCEVSQPVTHMPTNKTDAKTRGRNTFIEYSLRILDTRALRHASTNWVNDAVFLD